MSTPGVAEEGKLPEGGTVLSPNANKEELFGTTSGLEQFGTELTNPNAGQEPAVAVDKDGKPLDPTLRGRWEHHQSRADKAEADLQKARLELAEKAKYDPLVNLIRSDDETFRYVQDRLKGNRTPAKPLEAPQKPDSYNEVEAFSNPESASFKYRKSVDSYRDARIEELDRQNKTLFEVRQREEEQIQIRQAQEGQMKKFRDEAIAKGIVDQEFGEFFQLVNGASIDDMVDYFQYKKGKTPGVDPSRFMEGFPRSAGGLPKKINDGDIGSEMLAESRRM